ncbi:MAG: helix-turn-helix transcriptional regulator [Lachnospiraceae bacterium]|nr:helix-turn-helix transcriptional regulator [Lachnospiraceae bacterium]
MIQIDYCGYHTHNPDHSLIYRPSGSDSYLFLLILSPMEFRFADGTTEEVKPGACILYEPGFYQFYQAHNKFYNSYVHFFCDPSLIDRYHIRTNTIFYPDNTEEIHWLLKKIYQEYLNRQSDHEQMLHCYINQLLILISRIQQQTEMPGEQPASVFPELLSIREQMLRDCEKPWTVDELCRILNLGKSQLYHYYHQFFHCSPKDELIQARLQKACFLLTNDAITIREAAFESGFQNINHFNRIFRKVYGCTPGEYRNQKKVGR